jgi:hypothetical protein
LFTQFYSGKAKDDFRVYVGDWDNNALDEFEQNFEVEEIYLHQNYDSKDFLQLNRNNI